MVGWLTAVGFLLCVRVFDEHKDFEEDRRLHPERLLSRGVVSLSELRAVNAVNITAMVVYCLWIDRGVGPVTLTWAVAFIWLLLMRSEFFVGGWLRPRLVLYALSHAVVTPLVTWWMFTSGSQSMGRRRVLLPYAVAAYASSLLFEFARKMLPPVNERLDVATYTSVLGPRIAASWASMFAVGHTVGIALVLISIRSSVNQGVLVVGLVAMISVATVCVAAFTRFGWQPSDGSHGPLEPLAGLTLLVPSLVVIIAVLVAADVDWRWS